MGHAAAESVVKAGLTLVPYTLSGYSAGVAVANIGVLGIPVELVGKDQRQEAMSKLKERYPNLIVVDYTTPYCVNGGYLCSKEWRELAWLEANTTLTFV
jgi:4-hydroxy-tetrahydrodipicolinate reductase